MKKNQGNIMDFQQIANVISPVFPVKWEKARVFCQLDQDSYEFFFFVKVGGEYIQNFDLEKEYAITRKEIRAVFKELFLLMKDSQKENNWRFITLLINSNGDFKADYDYKEGDVTLENKEDWKKQYLD